MTNSLQMHLSERCPVPLSGSGRVVREANHIALLRENEDGTRTPMTIPNHPTLKKSTLRTILTQSKIDRNDFLKAYFS
jgi:hypothetical protein